MSLQATARSKLEKELAMAKEQISSVGKKLREVSAERDALAEKLAVPSGSSAGSGARPSESQLQRSQAEQLRRRLGAFQAAKDDEVRALNKKLDEAHEATEVEMVERQRVEKQLIDALRRLSEASSALDIERRHASAVGTERERLQQTVSELQFALREQAIVLESEQQMRYAYEDQLGITPALGKRPAIGATLFSNVAENCVAASPEPYENSSARFPSRLSRSFVTSDSSPAYVLPQ